MVTQSARVSSHNSSIGNSVLDREGDLRTRTRWSHQWFDCECGDLGHISECHSSSRSSSWTRLWGEFTMGEEQSLEQYRTVVPRNWKTDQWSKWNHWFQDYWFQRCHVDVDKLIVRNCLSAHQRQNLPLHRHCALRGKKWEKILLRTGRGKFNGIRENNHFKEMNRIGGMLTESEWKIFTGISALVLREDFFQKLLTDLQWELEHFKGMIIFMSMFNDIVWDAKGNKEQFEHNSQAVSEHDRIFPRGHWSFLRPGSEEKWYGTYTHKPDGSWDETAEKILLNFAGPRDPIFRERRQGCCSCCESCTTVGLSRKTRSHQNFRKAWGIGETRCRKSWNQIKGYDSQNPRNVKQVCWKTKDHRLDKYKSKNLISDVLMPWNLKTDPKKRLKDNSMCPKQGMEPC